MIVFKGKSKFDNKPIAVIATGFDRPSKNVKTGEMIQLTTIPVNQLPTLNKETNKAVSSMCGDCPLRHGMCYVRTEFSTNAIFKAFKNKRYGKLLYDKFVGKSVRFGADGEPSLLPIRIIKAITRRAKNWTGYTHQWQKGWAQKYKKYFMASVQTLAEKEKANAAGWRTFRIVQSIDERSSNEVVCPNYTHGIQCVKCGLCRGTSSGAKNIIIPAHGGSGKLTVITDFLKNGG